MAAVWARLRDRLASIDSSRSMIEATPDYAAHFYYMYGKNYDGKHMTGDQVKSLLLTLPFMLRDLKLPEVMCTAVTFMNIYRLRHRKRYRKRYRKRNRIRRRNSYRIQHRIHHRMRYRIRF
jgi:hypothetical protein